MSLAKTLTKDEYHILKEGDIVLTAQMVKIQSFSDEEKGPHLRVLLADITTTKGELLLEEQWIPRISLVKLAKNHLGAKIKFKAHCLQYVCKGKKGPELVCYIHNVREVELLKDIYRRKWEKAHGRNSNSRS